MGEGGAPKDSCRKWLARAVHRGIELDVLCSADVLAQVTPEVLAEHLPAELVTKILDDGLGAGTLTPEGVLASTPSSVLAAHVPLPLLWRVLETAAEKTGLAGGSQR